MRRKHRLLIAALAALLSLAAPAAAQPASETPSAPASETPSAPASAPTTITGPTVVCPNDAAVRFAFIRDSLHRTAHWSRVWYGSWVAGYGVLTVASAGIIPAFQSRNDRITWGVSAATSFVGVVFTAANWPAAITESKTVERLATTSTDVCADLAEAERALSRAAENQIFNRKWYWHVANVALNLGAGLVIGFVAHDWISGAVNFGVGTGIGEAGILTMPMGSVKDRERYRRGEYAAASSPAPPSSGPALSLVPIGGRDSIGLGLVLAF